MRDMGNDWEHLARFLGYSDDLISEIKSKSNWDVKSQIHSFMRVCLIPDCGELRTEEIMKKIKNFLSQPSQSKLLIFTTLSQALKKSEGTPGTHCLREVSLVTYILFITLAMH